MKGFTQHQRLYTRVWRQIVRVAYSARRVGAGFTLLETLVAVTILALAVGGPLYVADRAYVAAQISRDQLIATSLAQEGIEYVRTMRDHEFISAYQFDKAMATKNGWAAFTTGPASAVGSIVSCLGKYCTLDPYYSGPNPSTGTNKALSANTCTVGVTNALANCAPLTIVGTACATNPAGCYYTLQSGGAATPFRRGITAKAIGANLVQVKSEVTWKNHGTDYTVTAIDYLTPWQ